MNSKDTCAQLIMELTGQDKVLFTPRGNYSIKLALKLVKQLEIPAVLTQDQGGWMAYSQMIEKTGLKEVQVKTDYGIIRPESLKGKKASEYALLLHSMPGYHALQDMDALRQANEFLIIINDATGSLGTEQAKAGDVILGSFGPAKPVNLGSGGFMATGNDDYFRFFKQHMNVKVKINYKQLYEKIKNLPKRLERLSKSRSKIIKDLKAYDIVNKESGGINIMLKCSGSDKEKLIKYCSKHKLEYTECPRYIRMMEKGICVEVKRLR